MPTPIDYNIDNQSSSIKHNSGAAGGFVDALTDNAVAAGESSLNLVNAGKGLINAPKKLSQKLTADGKRVIALGKRFQSAFGFVSANTGTSLQATNFKEISKGSNVLVEDGRSSYEEFTLKGNGVELKFGYGGLLQQVGNVFAPPALITFKRSKRIDETIVSNNDSNGNELAFGQVVENYGRKPIEISIKGVLIDMVNHQYPSEKVRQLIDVFDYNGSWEVTGKLFADHKIQTIYFTDLEDAPVQGFMDTWSFSLEARSIKPVEYFLKHQ